MTWWHMAGELLLPLYFANSGINTDISTLSSGTDWCALMGYLCHHFDS